jgi:hypothetical protein
MNENLYERVMIINKYFQKIMITFKQFLEEAKKKEIEKIKSKKGKLSKKQVMKILNSQGGIGGDAVRKYHENNPSRGPRTYTLSER